MQIQGALAQKAIFTSCGPSRIQLSYSRAMFFSVIKNTISSINITLLLNFIYSKSQSPTLLFFFFSPRSFFATKRLPFDA